MSKNKNRGLGRGLSALFAETEETYENAISILPEEEEKKYHDENEKISETLLVKENRIKDEKTLQRQFSVDIENIYANPNQPRKHFDTIALEELANSIEKHGLLSPILVVKEENGYMIIAGERRYRAAKLAGLKEIPVIVKEYTDRQIQEISLIENLQREDLNPIEVAQGIKQLMDEYNLTQDEVSKRLGKSRSAIANTLRLLTLSEPVIELISAGKLTSGHARALITLPAEAQYTIATECIQNGYSVRDIEKLANAYYMKQERKEEKKEEKKVEISLELKGLIEDMRQAFKTKVSLLGTEKKGRIYIDYYNRDDLNRIFEIAQMVNKERKENE